jgi:hypothetical protein
MLRFIASSAYFCVLFLRVIGCSNGRCESFVELLSCGVCVVPVPV